MSVAGTDLASTLSFLLLGLLVLALIVSIVIARARKAGSTTVALDLALTLGGWWSGLTVVAAVFVSIQAATGANLTLDGSALALPWPSGLPCRDGGTSAALVCGTTNAASVSVANASGGIRTLWIFAQLSHLALWAMPAALIAIIAFHTLRGRAFGRTVTRSLVGGGVAVAALGIVSDLLSGVTATAALREVFPATSGWYPQTFQLSISPLPLLAAVGLVALAAVFRQGMRLQREKEILEKDTEGLV